MEMNKNMEYELTAAYILNRSEELIEEYEKTNNIDVLSITQLQWNYVLYYLCKNIFVLNGKRILDYSNIDLLDSIADIYIYELCQKYNKSVSLNGFCTYTGINYNTVLSWYNGNSRQYIYIDTVTNTVLDYSQKDLYLIQHKDANIIEIPNHKYKDLVKKIKIQREHNLTDKTESGSIMSLALGKIEYGWIESAKERKQLEIIEKYTLPSDLLQKYSKD